MTTTRTRRMTARRKKTTRRTLMPVLSGGSEVTPITYFHCYTAVVFLLQAVAVTHRLEFVACWLISSSTSSSVLSSTSSSKSIRSPPLSLLPPKTVFQCRGRRRRIQLNQFLALHAQNQNAESNERLPIMDNVVTKDPVTTATESVMATTESTTQKEEESTRTRLSCSDADFTAVVTTSVWNSYKSMVNQIMSQPRVLKTVKQADCETIERCVQFLLEPLGSSSQSDTETEVSPTMILKPHAVVDVDVEYAGDNHLRATLKKREERFLQRYNFTHVEYGLISRCLSYVGDTCAKKQYQQKNSRNGNLSEDTSGNATMKATDHNHDSNSIEEEQEEDPAVLVLIAWSKMKAMGLHPRENSLSTYLHVFLDSLERRKNDHGNQKQQLGLHSSESESNNENISTARTTKMLADTMAEVISWHDELYKPNEKTTTLRIKSLIYQGNIEGAERALSLSTPSTACDRDYDVSAKIVDASNDDFPDTMGDQRKLRTFMPLLEHYCSTGDHALSILRLFRQMRQSPATHIDCNAYVMILEALAQGRHFRNDAAPILPPENLQGQQKLFNHSSGPLLLDELLTEMAEDVLDLSPESAEKIVSSFQRGFGSNSETIGTVSDQDLQLGNGIWSDSSQGVAVGKVHVPESGLCPITGATLRLLSLDERQRQHVHDTLLEMARQQSYEFLSGNLPNGKKKKVSKNLPESATSIEDESRHGYDELLKFSKWLDSREGKPFTAIVDGPNVAYYGYDSVHYSTLKLVLDELESMGENPLVVMPFKYVQPVFRTSGYRQKHLSQHDLQVIESLQEEGRMYIVPRFCLDDYYWMLASVSNQTTARNVIDINVQASGDRAQFPGMRPLLVTNDQMRDHRLELLEPREFRRWCSCHIVKYNVSRFEKDEWTESRMVDLYPADVFSREIQGNPHGSKNGTVWHFPVLDLDGPSWLCLWVEQ